MENVKEPRPFNEWRIDKFDRPEDAAYTFGHHLIKYCRDEVMRDVSKGATENEKAKMRDAIHQSLHNVMDLLEGFWPLHSGAEHSVEYVLQVVVKNAERREVERFDISPCKQDLPIGFWKWALDGEFR